MAMQRLKPIEDEFTFVFEWDAQTAYIKHEPCGDLIPLISYETLFLLNRTAKIHAEHNCKLADPDN